MQHQGDRPVRADRPSLLSPDEQAAPERQGILSSLDGMQGQPRATPGPRPRSRVPAWSLAGAGAIVVGAALFVLTGGEERHAPAVAVAAAPNVPTAATVPEAPRAAPPTPVALAASAAPAAAVLRDEPAAPLEPELAVPMQNPLADMVASPAPERHKSHASRADKAEKTERGEAHAKAAHSKAHGKAHGKAYETAQEKRAKPRAVREQDSDVVLLAALMSHIDPASRKATPAQQLAACRRYNAAGEAQCRARVCETAGRKEPACKRVPAARTEPET